MLVDALTVKGDAAPAFHVNVLPFAIVATNTWPKLLNDHKPGSNIIWEACTALPKPVKFEASVTVAPFEWAWPFDVPAVAVPKAPLVIPVKVFVPFPV